MGATTVASAYASGGEKEPQSGSPRTPLVRGGISGSGLPVAHYAILNAEGGSPKAKAF